jgi:hypothetical protein
MSGAGVLRRRGLRCGACAGAGADKKASAPAIKILKLRPMHRVLHKSGSRLAEG